MAPILPFDDDPLVLVANLRSLADDLERLTMFRPSSKLTDAPVLSDWRLGHRAAPCLIGQVDGHPVLGSCHAITSEVFAIDPELRWARTTSRFYTLGRRRTTRSGR